MLALLYAVNNSLVTAGRVADYINRKFHYKRSTVGRMVRVWAPRNDSKAADDPDGKNQSSVPPKLLEGGVVGLSDASKFFVWPPCGEAWGKPP